MKPFRFRGGRGSGRLLRTGISGVCLLRAAALVLAVAFHGGATPGAADSAMLRYAAAPAVSSLPGGAAGAIEWTAAVDCAPPVDPVSLIGARVAFAFDFDLDGLADAADSLGIPPSDCGEVHAGRVALRRRFTFAHPAVMRAALRTAAGATTASHAFLTAGTGSLLAIARYCARPKNGEPEWIEVRNNTAFTVPLAAVRLEGRVLSGVLAPGESLVAGSDTAELRLWQPGARVIALSSWSNLRNTADTLRLSLTGAEGALILDSLFYPSAGSGGAGAGAFPREECASLQSEESGAGAHGFALQISPARWRPGQGPLAITVRAPAEGRYDLRVFDLDGAERCVLARNTSGATVSAIYSLPHPACAGLGSLGARRGAFVLYLQPRAGPGVRKVFRITE